MNLELNRAQRSKLHIAILEALDAPTNETDAADAVKKQAFAEAVAWADSGEIADLGTLFNLADAITFQVDQHVYRSDCQYAEVIADDIREVHGTPTVNLALKLAGYFPRQRDCKMVWTDPANKGCTEMIRVVLAVDFLDAWNREC